MLQPGNIALERLYSQYFYESVGSHMILDPRISPSWSFLLVVENNLTLQACDDTTKAAKSTKKWRHGTFPRAFSEDATRDRPAPAFLSTAFESRI